MLIRLSLHKYVTSTKRSAWRSPAKRNLKRAFPFWGRGRCHVVTDGDCDLNKLNNNYVSRIALDCFVVSLLAMTDGSVTALQYKSTAI